MNNAITVSKKAFTIFVAAATIIWMAGVASLVPTASAYDAGDLIKGETLSTVYYYASDGSRYTFPNENTYFTWYEDFSGVETITDEELADIPLAGNIVYRPGSRWIKIQSSAKTYAVTPQGQIRWIETEEVAEGLAGEDWNTFIDDVADVFFADYTEGTSLMDASEAYNGALVSGSTYLIWNGEKRLVTDDGMTANGFQERFVLSGTGVDLEAMTAGDDLTGSESELTDTAQLGEEVTGGLEVEVASDTAASATLPASSAAVPLFSFDLSANTGTAEVSQIIVSLAGVGATANFDNVYLYEGNSRITSGRSINSSTREVTFGSLDISLDNGETQTYTVRGDIAAAPTAGDTAIFEISSASDITSTATVSGDFSVSGNSMSFTTTTAGTVTVGNGGGTVSDPTLGEEGATIAKFSLAAASEDAHIEQIALNVSKVNDHSNYMLYQGSDMYATGTVSGDLVTFVFTNTYVLAEGETKNFYVTADIGGDAQDTLTVGLEETTDLMAIGGDYGFNMAVTDSYTDDSTTIQGGQLTFAFNGPSATDIAVDSSDQVLMNFTLTAAQEADIRNIEVEFYADDNDDSDTTDGTDDAGADTDGLINSTSGDANLSDLRLVNTETGTTVSGPYSLSTSTTSPNDAVQAIDFTDDFMMEAGESIDFAVTVDIDNDCPAGETFAVKIDMSEVEARDVNNDALTNATDIIPTADITGYDMTSTASSLTVNITTPPGSDTFVKGTSGVDMAAFAFQAGAASDITVTDVTFNAQVDDDGDTTYNEAVDDAALVGDVQDFISSCSIYDYESGSMIDGPESFDTSDDVAFGNFSWDVPAGETKKLLVDCNLANVATASSNDDVFAIEIDAAGDITAQDEDGDSVTATVSDGNTGETVIQTVTSSGSIAVATSGSTPAAGIILGASTGVSMSVFKFTATNEDFEVNKIVLRNCVTTTADADDDCADGGETAGQDDTAAAVKVSYEDESGTTQTKTGYLVSNAVTFDNMDFYVPSSESKNLTVTIDTNTVTGSTDSGDTIQLNFDAEDTGTVGDFKAVGADSGTTVEEGTLDTYALGQAMTLRKTKPTLSLASGSPSGAGIPGLGEVFRFNVSADSRGYVTLDEFTFKLTSTDNGSSSWNLCDDNSSADGIDNADWSFYDMEDTSTELESADTDWVYLTSDLTVCTEDTDTVDYAILDLTVPREVAAGETRTYSVEMDTTYASASDDDSVRMSIPKDSEVATNGGSDPDGALIWDDDNQGTDIDGTYVKTLPLTGGTILY